MLFLGGLIFSVLLSRSLKFSLVLRAHTQQLEHRALHDALTRLPNKKLLGRRLQAFFTRLHEREGVLWVVALDLNGLKMINDSMGHTVGDRVLKLVAGRIQAISGSASMVARLEGDEFVLVFLDVSNTDVSDTVQRVMAEVARPYEIDGMELRVTASAGVTATRRGVSDPMELVREAELAMAWAKRDGGNTLHLYSPELSVPVQERLALRTELQHALEHEQFELHYQPIVDVRGGTIVGAEALLRWPHPVRGVISPRHFIALAEETGQIVPLSNWVLDTACRDISILKERNHASFPVVVNVSPLHFRRADFVDVLQRALARHNLPEGSLDLEITEGMVVDHTEDALDKLNRIRELGVRVSIDDFGTGYSSLNYLKNLPIDKIKIDQSFVRDVISDRRDAAITKAIIGLAHHLNLKVVAEGVETESQFWFLKRNFCDEVQGYLFQRPVPFSDFSQILFEQGGRVSMPVARIPVESDKVLLLLDDEPNILRALTRLLRRDGYRILTATTPQQAFTLLAENNVQVVMSDQRMPEMTGTEFFSQVKELYPETIRLVLSGYTDLKSVTDAINRGAIYRFLTKPWDDEDLRREIAEAFKGYHSQDMHA
jgi:diguanylate cyclase (GGDEF)-like protein